MRIYTSAIHRAESGFAKRTCLACYIDALDLLSCQSNYVFILYAPSGLLRGYAHFKVQTCRMRFDNATRFFDFH